MIEIGNIGSTAIENVIEIKDVENNVVAKYAIGDKDTLTKMLMQEHNVSISFRYPTFVSFKKGYYLTFKGVNYWLMNDYKAVETNGEYRYDLVFHAKEMLFQDAQMYYTNSNVEQSEYGMTGNATYFLQLAVENINNHFGVNFVNKGTAEPTDIKYIQFANDTNVFDALGQVCDTFDCEWLLVGDTINIVKKANFGDAIDFKVGTSVLSINRREGENTFDANRILALGSTLNLTEDYQGGDYMIGAKRLRINPSKGKYIDLKPNLKPTEVKTATVIFDDIFPKRIATLDEVRAIEYKVDEGGSEVITKQYRFKDNGIAFSDDYLLPNEPLMLVFETGKLAGLHFELYFSKDGYSETDNSQYYEILVNTNYGSQLPNDTLKPEIGDKYVLYNFNIELVSHIYIPEAENELFEYATKWLKEEWTDKGVYECPIMGRYSRDNDVDLEIGQRVDLYSPIFDSGKRESRIMGYVKPLMSKFDAIYTIGDNKAYSPKSNIQQRITKLEATEYAINGVGGSSGDVYIIKQFDNSPPTDFNVYSAKASNARYFNKQTGDTVQGYALFQKNVQVQGNAITDVVQNSTFQSGEFGTGYQIKNDIGSGKSYMEVDNLRVRDEMIVSQLTIDEIKSVDGSVMLSLASLKATEVQDLTNTYRVSYDNQNGELVNKFVVGDQALSQTFNGGEIKRYWRLVTAIGDNYIELSKTDAEIGSKVPTKDDIIVQFGHRTNVNRQYAQLISSYPPFGYRQYNGINSFSTQNKEITRIGDPINGNYFEAAQFVIKAHGVTSPIYRDRGLFANGTQYYKNDRVSWLGSLWLCLEDTKTIPSETATFWRKETSGQTDINNSINNIQIGSVNLINDSKRIYKGKTVSQGNYIEVKPSKPFVSNTEYSLSIESTKILEGSSSEYFTVRIFNLSTNSQAMQFTFKVSESRTVFVFKTPLLANDGFTMLFYTGIRNQAANRSMEWNYVQLEQGNKGTSWSPSPQDIQNEIDNAQNTANNAQALANSSKNYIDNVLQNELEDIRDQIDGKVNSYFYDYDPTVNNIPASEWATEQQKEDHVNDTFTNTYSGMSWRWLKVNGVYDWVVISDTAATEALAKAAEALQIANNKMQVFVNTPYTPYQVGDLWVQGANGDILRCNVSRLNGDFDANDWGRASNYTDDTAANEANNKADEALNEIVTVRSEFNSELSIQNDKINAKVSQVDFDNLDNVVTNTKSEVEQLAGSLTSTIEKVDNIQIGGVNLCSNTDVSKDGITSAWLGWKGTMQYSKGNYIRLVRSKSTDQDFGIQSPLILGGLKEGKEYTVSFEIGSYYSTSIFNYNFIISSVGNTRITSSDFSISAATTALQYRYFTFKADKDYPDARIMIGTGTGDDAIGGQGFTIRKFQVEEGNKPTHWSPSPQDIQNEIENAQNTANSKTRTYRQDTTPTVPSGGHTVGDTWSYVSLVDFDGNINTDASKNVYQLVRRWSGSDWVRINWSASRTKVVQTDDQIRQTVEKTGIDNLGQEETLYSRIDSRADSIQLEVGKIQDKLSNKNILIGTNQGSTGWSGILDEVITPYEMLGVQGAKFDTNPNNGGILFYNSVMADAIKNNGVYTLSFDIESDKAMDIGLALVGELEDSIIEFGVKPIPEGLSKVVMTATANLSAEYINQRLILVPKGAIFSIANLQLEEGAVATDWSEFLDGNVTKEIKSGVKIESDGVNVYGEKFVVDSTLIANAIEAESLDVGGNMKINPDGSIDIANGKIKLNADGSGRLANGGIFWDKDGFLDGIIASSFVIENVDWAGSTPAPSFNIELSDAFNYVISQGSGSTPTIILPTDKKYNGVTCNLIGMTLSDCFVKLDSNGEIGNNNRQNSVNIKNRFVQLMAYYLGGARCSWIILSNVSAI